MSKGRTLSQCPARNNCGVYYNINNRPKVCLYGFAPRPKTSCLGGSAYSRLQSGQTPVFIQFATKKIVDWKQKTARPRVRVTPPRQRCDCRVKLSGPGTCCRRGVGWEPPLWAPGLRRKNGHRPRSGRCRACDGGFCRNSKHTLREHKRLINSLYGPGP